MIAPFLYLMVWIRPWKYASISELKVAVMCLSSIVTTRCTWPWTDVSRFLRSFRRLRPPAPKTREIRDTVKVFCTWGYQVENARATLLAIIKKQNSRFAKYFRDKRKIIPGFSHIWWWHAGHGGLSAWPPCYYQLLHLRLFADKTLHYVTENSEDVSATWQHELDCLVAWS